MSAGSDSILIVGRNGQVSRSLDEALKRVGRGVVTVGRPEVDLCDLQSVSQAILAARPKIVVNAAAYTAVDGAEDERETAYAVNARGAEAVALAAAEADAAIIHFSTDYVFDGTKHMPYVETDAVAPTGVYGESKLAGERLVAAANPRHVILRTAWVFSPFGSNFAKTMLRLNGERSEISVVADQHGNPTYAPDLANLASAIMNRLAAAAPDPRLYGTFHAVNSGETTWCAFARAIIDGAAERGARRASIRPIATRDYATKVRRPAYSVLSTRKLTDVYGIALRPWIDAVPDCLDRLLGPDGRQELQRPEEVFDKSA